jgi:AAA ATPase domain
MRLHRLVLTNYRGITHREIDFPERGVTVVSGPNEVGKSSMIEALDLLLESKDRSSKRDVKQVKPTHADVGSEVTAEISTGKYRFVYRKRFHKKCETELTILAPQREQVTGDEAHDRVRSMLAETVDTGLWQAQRVLQATSTSAVDLSGCDALSRALDVAAGDAADLVGLSGTEPLLIEKIDAEYSRYFTATGRPTGEWAAATAALAAAEADVAHCAAAVAEVHDRVRRHAQLTEELAEMTGGRAELGVRVAAAEAAATAIAALCDELRAAQNEATAATVTSTAASAAHKERLRLRAEANTRAATVAEAEVAAAEASESAATGRAVLEAAEEGAAAAAVALREAQARSDAARRAVTELSERDETHRLTARLARIDAAQREQARLATELRDIPLTDRGFRDIESGSAAVDLARAQVDLAAPTVAFTAETDVVLVIGDRRVTLSAGQTQSLTVAEATAIGLPGVGTLAIAPGAPAAEIQAKLVAAQRLLAEALAGPGVADVDAARRLDETRRDLLSQRDQLTATLSGLLGDDDEAPLRARLDALRLTRPPAAPTGDPVTARAELDAADAARVLAAADCEMRGKVAAAAATQCTARSTRATVLREQAAAARAEHTTARDRLTAQQAEISDDDLAVQAQVAAERAARCVANAGALSVRLADANPDAVADELAASRAADAAFRRQHDELAQTLRDVTVELALIGTEGRTGKLDAAQVRRAHAGAEHARVQGRAHAARMLREVMTRHRDNTRLRYVEPFRAELERLGRTVFGSTFEVEVDSDLQICNRTLDGRTVPFESLSGGAKEQLGILARLAVAALVDKADTVPVMIDDALGFTDPDRLAKMGAVFDTVGAQGQVIVLTCVSDRYRGVTGAHTVELTA